MFSSPDRLHPLECYAAIFSHLLHVKDNARIWELLIRYHAPMQTVRPVLITPLPFEEILKVPEKADRLTAELDLEIGQHFTGKAKQRRLEVVSLAYGLDSGQPQTLSKIASQLNASPEAVRDLWENGLYRMGKYLLRKFDIHGPLDKPGARKNTERALRAYLTSY